MRVLVTAVLMALTLLSVVLLLWQYVAARRFPLHRTPPTNDFAPGITLLKPVKGCDEPTAECLRSWMTQRYPGEMQMLFGVADEKDPVCEVVRTLIRDFPHVDAQLLITSEPLGPNAKVANVLQLARQARHEILCVSDADVFVEPDFLSQSVAPLRNPEVGLVNCFYRLATPATLAMRWEALAVNADFWSQVLQSNTLHRQNFALGAVMMARRSTLASVGGFEPLLDYLADDYQLGHRIAATGARIALARTVVECREKPAGFRAVWNHQLRWARTIRASQPLAYFFSILSNVTLWSLLLMIFGAAHHVPVFGWTGRGALYFPFWSSDPGADGELAIQTGYNAALLMGLAAILLRMLVGSVLAVRLTQQKLYHNLCWLVPIKDLLQFGIWLGAFLGNTVEWSGKKFRLRRGGRLVRVE